jgi:hypothetical protein
LYFEISQSDFQSGTLIPYLLKTQSTVLAWLALTVFKLVVYLRSQLPPAPPKGKSPLYIHPPPPDGLSLLTSLTTCANSHQMHNLNSIPNPAVKRVCTESKKTPLQSTTAFTVSNCLASLVLCPAALCVCDVVCVRVCCEQRKTVCMMFDQTPPMVFRYDVMDITTSACFRGVVYCCDSVEDSKIRLFETRWRKQDRFD